MDPLSHLPFIPTNNKKIFSDLNVKEKFFNAKKTKTGYEEEI